MPETRSMTAAGQPAVENNAKELPENQEDGGTPATQTEKNPPLHHENPPHSPTDPLRSEGRGSRKSQSVKSRSRKQFQLAQKDEEIAKLKLELAMAQKATIALETEESEDDDSIPSSRHETLKRTATWVQLQKRQAEQDARDTPALPSNPTAAKHHTEAPAAMPASQEATCFTQPPQKEGVAPHRSSRPLPQEDRKTDLSELARAITLAARTATPHKYFGKLPIFNGSHNEWLPFKSAYFETSNHYSSGENTARLRQSLVGRAKEAVGSLLIVNTTPEDIMKTLEARFGRPDSIALAELEKLRNLSRTTDSPRDICVFANKVKNCVATLQYLGKAHYLASPETMKNVIEKLTPTLRYRWYNYAADEKQTDSDLQQFSSFLERETDRVSRFAPPEQMTEETPRTIKRGQRAHLTSKKEDKVQSCAICERRGHEETECAAFTEADSDGRWELAKKNNLCYRCLRPRKSAHKCPRRECERDGCVRSHHTMLHFERKSDRDREEEKETERVTSTFSARKRLAYLKIIPVRVSGPSGHVNTYALLDDGSTITLISANIAKQIGAKGPQEPLNLETISDDLSSSSSRRVTITVRGQDRPFDIQAHTIEKLRLSSQTIEEQHVWGCEHLEDIQQHLMYEDAKPTILVGQDNWHLLVATDMRKGNRNQVVASRTPLGWVLHGSDTRTIGRQVNFVHHLTSASEPTETIEERMDEQLRHYFALESIDIQPKQPRSEPEHRALAILDECTKETEDGRYETAPLWNRDGIKLPSNYDSTLKRLVTTERRIDKDARLKQKYNKQMEELIEKGYAERAPTDSKKDRTWYLPHFPVLNPMKPDKVRIVLDAAAKTKGQSLNDHLLTGPDLLQSLPGVLMRFRQHRVAVTADIAEMFLRVGIRQEDRDALRYLWRGERRDGPPEEYRMTSLIFGATSSPSTAIYVKNKNAEKYRDVYPAAVTAIVKNHYMDDYLDSFPNYEEAIEVSKQVQEIHNKGNFNLRSWASNSSETLTALAENTQTQLVKLDDGTKAERVLGLIWKPQTDELSFNLDLARIPPALLTERAPTKREALRIIMSVYDPLGLASPITVQAKKVMQEAWSRGTKWDEKIDEDLAEQWTSWMRHLQDLRNISVPRCYLQYSAARSLQLHVFADASTTAYAAALYWRAEAPDGSVHISLITAKARVAPLKLTSVPRLELQAAVLGSRMAAAVLEEHSQKPESKTFWTDSLTILAWLRNGARTYKAFVAHRIAAIQEITSTAEWRWIPTKQNVADDATREVPADFSSKHRWYRGPEFLLQNSSQWPTEKPTQSEPTGEEKTVVFVTTNTNEKIARATPEASRFSRWERLLRTTARVLQFIEKCKGRRLRVGYSRTKKNRERDPEWKRDRQSSQKQPLKEKSERKERDRKYLPIEADLLRRAEKQIVRLIQEESFKEEIHSLRKGRATHKTDRLRSLSVVLIDDVIHLRGRVNAAAGVTDRQKNPPVLDGNHRATKLWAAYIHRRLLHAGAETTVNECRQQYWILRLRPIVKEVISRCLHCRIRKTMPTAPPTGDLPSCRLAHHRRAFTYTGVDYFGPLSVTVGRQHQKRYVALFTCLTMRAVHLELTTSLSTDSAILAVRRFIARRGCPAEMWSDNGTNFRGADAELRRAALEAAQTEATARAITWRFIPPGAPFMGGAWERLVRSTKTALFTALHERHPHEEVLRTLLAEAEYTVNSHPLTHVSVQPEDDEALTPNHLLLGGSALVPTAGTFDDRDLVNRSHWRASQRLADLFWARWIKEYLPELQNRREPRGTGDPVTEGDLVLIVDGNLPRNTWPRGVVIATYPGPDGAVRVVDVKTKGGVLRRPVKRLVILPTRNVSHQ